MKRKGDGYTLPQGWDINVYENYLLDSVLLQSSAGHTIDTAFNVVPATVGGYIPANTLQDAKAHPQQYLNKRYRRVNRDKSFVDGTIVGYDRANGWWIGSHDNPIHTDTGDVLQEDFNATELRFPI